MPKKTQNRLEAERIIRNAEGTIKRAHARGYDVYEAVEMLPDRIPERVTQKYLDDLKFRLRNERLYKEMCYHKYDKEGNYLETITGTQRRYEERVLAQLPVFDMINELQITANYDYVGRFGHVPNISEESARIITRTLEGLKKKGRKASQKVDDYLHSKAGDLGYKMDRSGRLLYEAGDNPQTEEDKMKQLEGKQLVGDVVAIMRNVPLSESEMKFFDQFDEDTIDEIRTIDFSKRQETVDYTQKPLPATGLRSTSVLKK